MTLTPNRLEESWALGRDSASLQKNHNNFDALRLVAAWAVLFSHQFPVIDLTYPDFVNIPMVGGAAVMAFFSISGYLVTLSWQHQPSFWCFAGKRFLRLWPALCVVSMVCLFIVGPVFTALPLRTYWTSTGTWDYLENLLLRIHYPLPGVFGQHPLPNAVNGPLWTIPIEATCYAVLAIAGLFGLLKNRYVWVSLCGAYLAWFLGTQTMDLRGAMQHWLEFPAYFVFGSLIASLNIWFLRQRFAWSALATAVALITYSLGFKYSALLIFLPPFLISIGTVSWPVLSQAGRFGDVSYGVYLYAFPIQQSVYALWPALSFGTSLLVVTIFTLCAGWLSWRLVEAPALRLKRYLR